MNQVWMWVGFNVFVLAMLAVDLLIFHRKSHEVSMKEASAWTVVWISLAMVFNAGIYSYFGPEVGLQFLTGYLIEKALSVDNIFVFVLIFAYFKVPPQYQHRVLFWGILGALVMRGSMVGLGALLIKQFHWIIYVFGAFLVITGIRMATQKEHDIEPESNPVIRLIRKVWPVTNRYHGDKFFIREEVDGKGLRTVATPLFVVLVMVETTDLIFAVDSVPAIFAITEDPFIVYTSNVFAILGLRSLYFLLAGVIHKFHFLQIGLSLVLIFVGTKMLMTDYYKIPVGISLGVIALILITSVVASLMFPKQLAESDPVEHDPLESRPDDGLAPIDPEVSES
jgi:tellurite resistance protein TerC